MRGPQPWQTVRARNNRSNATSAESLLWSALRNRRLAGHKFVRQLPIGPYFTDFACRDACLVVEIDGVTHASEAELAADAEREAEIAELGFRTIRISNSDVYENLTGVLEMLLLELERPNT